MLATAGRNRAYALEDLNLVAAGIQGLLQGALSGRLALRRRLVSASFPEEQNIPPGTRTRGREYSTGARCRSTGCAPCPEWECSGGFDGQRFVQGRKA
jgi:hypothetical protein